MPDDTPRVPDRSDPGRSGVGRDQRSRRVRALALLAAIEAGLSLGFLGGGPRRRLSPAERERIALADIELDVGLEGKRG